MSAVTLLRPEGEDWQRAPSGRRCRQMTQRRQCFEPAVFMLLRHGKRRTWWCYCAKHAFGRVLLDDGIYHAYEPTVAMLEAFFGDVALAVLDGASGSEEVRRG